MKREEQNDKRGRKFSTKKRDNHKWYIIYRGKRKELVAFLQETGKKFWLFFVALLQKKRMNFCDEFIGVIWCYTNCAFPKTCNIHQIMIVQITVHPISVLPQMRYQQKATENGNDEKCIFRSKTFFETYVLHNILSERNMRKFDYLTIYFFIPIFNRLHWLLKECLKCLYTVDTQILKCQNFEYIIMITQ